QKIVSQPSPPPTVKVAGKSSPAQQALVVTALAEEAVGGVYTININGVDYSYTHVLDDTDADVAAGLAAAIDGASITDLTVTDNLDGTIDLDMGSNTMLGVYTSSPYITVVDNTPAGDIADDLNAVLEIDN